MEATDMAYRNALSDMATAWEESGDYVNIDGHRIFFHDVGEGPVILLLHGHPSSSHDWEKVVEILKPKARLISFDHIGWGLSDKPVAFSYSLMQLADITEKLLKKLAVTKAHVVSHDISTSVHTELMARHLEGSLSFKMLSAMLTNGSILQWVSNEPDEQNLAAHNETLFEAIKGFKAMGPKFKEMANAATLGNLSDEKVELMKELHLRDHGLDRMAAISVYMRERYVHAERWVGAIEKFEPLRIVWAVDDPVANIAIGRELNERAPQAAYAEILGVGHFPNAEAPEEIAKHILLSTGI
jgi:pimeloyl-ACP methyl ester carboxylesterase